MEKFLTPSVFDFHSHSVRVINRPNGETLFNAIDVTRVLGYKNGRDAVGRICRPKGVVKCDTPTAGGIQSLSFLTESNLYRLVLRSELPNAEEFQDWVTEQVLPQIRKTGAYTAFPALPDFTNPVAAARAWADAEEKKLQLQAQILLEQAITEQYQQESQRLLQVATEAENNLSLANQVIVAQQPAVEFVQKLVEAGDLVTMEEAAKTLAIKGLGRNNLFNLLVKKKVFSTNKLPYQKFVDAGYFQLKQTSFEHQNGQVHLKNQVMVTSVRGIEFLRRLLAKSPV